MAGSGAICRLSIQNWVFQIFSISSSFVDTRLQFTAGTHFYKKIYRDLEILELQQILQKLFDLCYLRNT